MKIAYKKHILIPAFNVAYLPMLKPISDALCECNCTGIIEVSRPDIINFGAKSIEAVALEFEKNADLRYCFLHLDHVPVIDENYQAIDWQKLIKTGIELGFDSVMIDGSRLAFEQNIKITRTTVKMAHQKGVCVEAELGSVLGHEKEKLPPYEEIFEKKIGFTEPEKAKIFIEETTVDWLSVSAGSIHGAISGAAKDRKKPSARIDIDHLAKINEKAKIPLVLHGGSGISPQCIKEAVKNGITKINIGTEIRQAYQKALKSGKNFAQENVKKAVKKILETYQICNSAELLK
ncbi:MAG: class II fructose-bisphosphate aldolase [Candidatus Omnitrophica bacterium]|nr:class II fructose-bisphosphate aldolase [Candidatus Omnitrophota bacterium]